MASGSEASEDVREADPTQALSAPDQEALESDHEDSEMEPGVKRMKVAEQLTVAQEEDLAEWFAEHPLFFDQSTKKFKMRSPARGEGGKDGVDW